MRKNGRSRRLTAAKLSLQEGPDNIININRVDRRGPDGSWGWFVVFNSFLCNMIVDGVQYTFANFLIPITMSLNSSVPEVSLIGSLLSGFYNFSGPVAGALGNKFGFRMVVITGSLLSAGGLMLSFFAPDIYFLYFFYGVLGGLGFGMIYMASVITTSVYFEKYRALAASISVCGTGVGTFVFAPLGNVLVFHYGWQWALMVEGGIVLLCILFGLTFKPVQILKMVPLSGPGSESTVGKLSPHRESIYYPTERRKTLANEAYPTLKEALLYDEERRSTIVSLLPRSQRTSIEEVERFSRSPAELSVSPSIESISQAVTRKDKCKMCCRICCFNFWHCSCKKKDLTLGDRPMYRDDVFYANSLSDLNFSSSDRLNYHLSITRVPDRREVEEHLRRKCCVCHHAFLRTCITMTGLNLLKSKIFSFLCVSSFLYTMGLYIPYVFIKEFALECDVSESIGIWMVSAIGISNTVGRLFSGVIKSLTKINAAFFVLGCLAVSGLFSFVFLFCRNIACIIGFSCIFGFFTAPFISLRPVVIVDFLGLEKLTNAFGLVLLSQGVASIIGPPIAGIIVKKTGSCDNVIYLSGSLMLVSSVALLISTMFKYREQG